MQTLEGQVISNKLAKTLTVIVRRRFKHPIYQKLLTRTKKYQVHNEMEIDLGETVKFIPCKPISKLKRWKVIEVVGRDIKKKENKAVSKKTETKGKESKADKVVETKAVNKSNKKTVKNKANK